MSRALRRSLVSSAACAVLGSFSLAHAAPSGAHPRLWLDAETLSGLAAQAGVKGSPVERGAARCAAARQDPSEYADGGWQGFEFVTTLSGCLLAYEAQHDPDDLATALKYWSVLLDDYAEVGDGAGGDDVVTHDTGYAMRTFAPYSAIAYDWLHDAPGVSEGLLAHARERFDAWVTYYAGSGYLKDLAGANYEAGYAFAATLVAIAEAGEAGSAGERHWSTVKDTIWGRDLAPALAQGGVLEGGDWPEGWQYGPLSVLELGLAARAMADNGAPVAGAGPWADSLVLRFVHGLTPGSKQTYTAGDTDADDVNRSPDNGALLAALAGPGSQQGKAWALAVNQALGLENDNPLFDGLALARQVTAAAPPSTLPTSHLARGAGNFYARGAWKADTVWGAFQCTRRLVDDHEHNDAGNFVLTRGNDDLVVDPSPYGTLSTLTSNAPAVDSNSLPSGYSPSQGNWGKRTGLAWARQSGTGVAVARCDYADQFRSDDTASDVATALRDFVLVPDGADGEVVLIDRVVTGDAGRGLHLRVRTPGALSLDGGRASARVGSASLAVERVYASSGAPNVRDMPRASECESSDHRCDVSRLAAGTEYRLDVAGPNAAAIHVVAARASAQGAHAALSGDGFRGVVVPRAAGAVAVVANDTPDGARGTSFTYRAPAGGVHVVVDAPADADGLSDVSAKLTDGACEVTVVPHRAGTGFDAEPLVMRVDAQCGVTDDVAPPSALGGTGEAGGVLGSAGDGASPAGSGSDAGSGEGSHADSVSAGSRSSGAGGRSGSSVPGAAGNGAVAGRALADAGNAAQASDGPTAPDMDPGCSVQPLRHGRTGTLGALGTLLTGLFVTARRRRRAARARR